MSVSSPGCIMERERCSASLLQVNFPLRKFGVARLQVETADFSNLRFKMRLPGAPSTVDDYNLACYVV